MSPQLMPEQKDTEIVLGTGRLLGIFFVLVAICGTFFGLGYSLGRSSSPMTLHNGAATIASSSGTKPVAGVTVNVSAPTAQPAPDLNANPNTAANAQVEQVPPPTNSATDDSAAGNTGSAPAVQPPADTNSQPGAGEAAANGNITVQVAAVTKQEDAQVLVAALRRKNYPVFVAPNTASDTLYHVQVGPFADLRDAEAMKSKLAGDGYNAIVKK